MKTKGFLRFTVACLLGFLTLSAIAGAFLAEVTLHPGRHLQSPGDEIKALEMAHLHNSELSYVNIAAQDGVIELGAFVRATTTGML